MFELVDAILYKLDRKSLKVHAYSMDVYWVGSIEATLESLKPLLNVGDVVELKGKMFKRVIGGFKRVGDEERALILACMLGWEG